MDNSITYKEFDSSRIEEIKDIYRSESWQAYLQDDPKLIRAYESSLSLFGAFDGSRLIGLVRCTGDGEHVLLVQDLIVHRDYQKQGIGTRLFSAILEKYAHVRMLLVITDKDDALDNKFYQSFHMKKLEERNLVGYTL